MNLIIELKKQIGSYFPKHILNQNKKCIDKMNSIYLFIYNLKRG